MLKVRGLEEGWGGAWRSKAEPSPKGGTILWINSGWVCSSSFPGGLEAEGGDLVLWGRRSQWNVKLIASTPGSSIAVKIYMVRPVSPISRGVVHFRTATGRLWREGLLPGPSPGSPKGPRTGDRGLCYAPCLIYVQWKGKTTPSLH